MRREEGDMLAVQLVGPGDVRLVRAPVPRARPDEIVLRVLAAGLCQTDVHICSAADSRTPDGTILGHEIAGTVHELGEGVIGWQAGDRVVVHPIWSCGTCSECRAGRENTCRGTGSRLQVPHTAGITRDGGMAEYVAVPARAVMRIPGGLDPAVAAVLTDAGMTPYHAIRTCADHLDRGASVAIIGVGGLGNLAAQILRATTQTKVAAVDLSEAALALTAPWVDCTFHSAGEGIAQDITLFSGGYGVDLVLDFVGSDETLALGAAVVARGGALRVIGLSGGTYQFVARTANNPLPRGVSITCPYGGTYEDLRAVIDLAGHGKIIPPVQKFGLAAALDAIAALAAGKVRGRAVLLP